MSALSVAAKGQGGLRAVHRAGTICTRYGVTPGKMERRVSTVMDLLEAFDGRATLPVTAATVERHPEALPRYAELGIEFAVHGYFHVDHKQLSLSEQVEQLDRARVLLTREGLTAAGFRAPYLRWSPATMDALGETGFAYDSSQAVHWPLDDTVVTDPYRRALDFYDSFSAAARPALPSLQGDLVQIPYCLPDDEAVVERLRLSPDRVAEEWLGIFRSIHERGELFTLAVHPERIDHCLEGISAVLRAASSTWPGVWFARLDDVARWWRARTDASVEIIPFDAGLRISVRGPSGVTILVRGLEVDGASDRDGRYWRAPGTTVEVAGERRPFVGVHASSPPSVAAFLRQQGYIVEETRRAGDHSVFVERERFSAEEELPLLDELERSEAPLVRLGRWPNGARSALCLTGDLDALTIWDYAMRVFGR
jgi:hypothetical protein